MFQGKWFELLLQCLWFTSKPSSFLYFVSSRISTQHWTATVYGIRNSRSRCQSSKSLRDLHNWNVAQVRSTSKSKNKKCGPFINNFRAGSGFKSEASRESFFVRKQILLKKLLKWRNEEIQFRGLPFTKRRLGRVEAQALRPGPQVEPALNKSFFSLIFLSWCIDYNWWIDTQ